MVYPCAFCVSCVSFQPMHYTRLRECSDLLKALAVVIGVYSLKFQKSLEALKWDQGLVYESYIRMLCGSLFQCLFLSFVDILLFGQLIFL